jgi:tetraacyldisaccharide 4'-kinase
LQEASVSSNSEQIGDEPYQLYRKYPKTKVIAEADRCKAIRYIETHHPSVDVVLLDDAFQHRYVKPTVSIVLTEHSRPVFNDCMLPAGHLRESLASLHRADIVIVTKCPDPMKQIEYRLFDKHLELYPYQHLFFSKYTYGELKPLYPDYHTEIPCLESLTEQHTIIVLAGIANPKPFIKNLRKSKAKIRGLIYDDHHNFAKNDILDLIQKIKTSTDPSKTIIVTTEKDAMRLRNIPTMPKSIMRRIFYLPIEVTFIPNLASTNQASSNEFAETLTKLLQQPNQL